MDDTRIIDSHPVNITDLRIDGEPFSTSYIQDWMEYITSMHGLTSPCSSTKLLNWKRTLSFSVDGKSFSSISRCFPHSFYTTFQIDKSIVCDVVFGSTGYAMGLPEDLLHRLPPKPSRFVSARDRLLGPTGAFGSKSSTWDIDDLLFRIREDGLATIYLKREAYERA